MKPQNICMLVYSFDDVVIIHKLFNTQDLWFPSISSTFYFSVLSYKAVSFRDSGRRENVHFIHDYCSML